MQYLGGKARLIKGFSYILIRALGNTTNKCFYEPFTGGFNIVPAIRPSCKKVICNDIHPGLICLYRHLQAGTIRLPNSISETEYKYLHDANDMTNPLTAFVAFACSFGAKEWGGYARNQKRDNYCLQGRRSCDAKQPSMSGVEFVVGDYRRKFDTQPDVIYADPPYANTAGYTSGVFDTQAFIEWCEAMSIAGSRVFVSEFNQPQGKQCVWNPIWSKNRQHGIRKQDATFVIDYIFEVLPPGVPPSNKNKSIFV